MAQFISEHYIFANYMKGNLKRIKIYIYIFLEISFSQMKCYNKLVSNKILLKQITRTDER
jgi:hypothetical protein